jgi:hypothetical protein
VTQKGYIAYDLCLLLASGLSGNREIIKDTDDAIVLPIKEGFRFIVVPLVPVVTPPALQILRKGIDRYDILSVTVF